MGGFLLLRTGGGTAVRADISDDLAKPISVAITPIVDDAPLLKLGSKRQPGKLPDRWIAPRPVERQAAAALPSPAALAHPSAIPTVPVSDAGKPPPPDAQVAKQADLTIPVFDAGPAPVSTTEGALDGVKNGTETDPLKAHAVNMYRAQLGEWFRNRVHIKGKVPFDILKDLKATMQIRLSAERTVEGFTLVSPSGNA